MYPLIILRKTRICTFVFLKRTRHFIFYVLSSRARRGGEHSQHENSKGFKISLEGWKREECVPAALYRRTCGSVFSSSKNYTSLLYFNKDSAAGHGFTRGFRRGVQHPLELRPNTPLHPSLYLAFILRTLPVACFWTGKNAGNLCRGLGISA